MRLASRFAARSNSIRSAVPLTDDQIRKVAPSVFAEHAHDSRSARYTYVPTGRVLSALRDEGFQPFFAAQTRARDENRREFTKHLIRLRRPQDASMNHSEEAPEVILLNSHDGTSSYQMLAGMFRSLCLNGMICGVGMDEIRVPHSGDIVGRVIEGAFTVVDEFSTIRENVEGMKAITLSTGEQQAFARAALVAKYGEQDAYPITTDDVLRVQRDGDAGADLWRTFNRTQETLIRGGVAYRTAQGRNQRTRAVEGIGSNVKLNRALWTLAEELAKLKAA